MNSAPPAISPHDWGRLFILSILWGGAFFLNVKALEGFPPVTLVFVRMAIAVLPLLVVTRLAGQPLPRGWAGWRGLILLAAMNIVIPFILFTWAQTRLASGLASVLNATTPLWGVVAAHFLVANERATPLRIAGVLLGVGGVTAMLLPSLSGAGGDLLAQAACLFATLCYALSSIIALRLNTGGMTPLTLTTGQVLAAAVMMAPLALAYDQPWTLTPPGITATLALVMLALASTSLAYWLFFRVLESAGANNSLIITFMMPVVAILIGVVALGERLSAQQLGGMALIAAGLVVMDGRLFRRATNA